MALKMAGPQPIVPKGFDLYITAFFELCTERPLVEGVTVSLPITKVVWYADFIGIDDVNRFVTVIRSMDTEYIKQAESTRKRQMAAATNKSKGKR